MYISIILLSPGLAPQSQKHLRRLGVQGWDRLFYGSPDLRIVPGWVLTEQILSQKPKKPNKSKKSTRKPKVLQHISNYGFIFSDFSGSQNPKNQKKLLKTIDFYSILAVLSKCVPSTRLATTYHHKH